MNQLNRSQHVYTSRNFDAVIRDTIRFFNQTPAYSIPISERFHGTGVYALYCTASSGIYSQFASVNRGNLRVPLYVGKAVPKGWRQARQTRASGARSYQLSNRIREHSRSIELGEGIACSDFVCRFVILEGRESDLIGTVEAALIRQYQPLWNTLIDGFGNHDPGKGRYEQAKSDWDVCHPGRPWADKCQGEPSDRTELLQRIEAFMNRLSNEGV